MPIAPSDATIQTAGTTGTITGNMASRPIPVGLMLYPGSSGGPNGPGREVTSFTAIGTTGATVTFKSAFPSDVAAGTAFYVPDGPASGTTGYALALTERINDWLQQMFGPDFVGSSTTSRQITLPRSDDANTFGRINYKVGNTLAFYEGQRRVGSRNEFGVQALPDGSTLIDAFSVDRATGSFDFTSVQASIASAATCNIGALRDRRAVITGTTNISSFGSVPNKERIVFFSDTLTLVHSASLICPGSANITTAAADYALAVSDASGNWRILQYVRSAGVPLKFAASGTFGSLSIGAVAPAGLYGDGTNVAVRTYNGGLFFIQTNNGASSLLTMTSDGNFGLGPSVFPQVRLHVGGAVAPAPDNTYSCGTSIYRWSVVYAGTGSISTSDGRLKTAIQMLQEAELAAARDLAREIGTFQFLDAVAEKGEDKARRHVGMTVQRAIEIMQAHGLDPFRYAFICFDSWEAQDAEPAVEAADAVLDEAGEVITPAQMARPAIPAREAGDRYSFRPDQLALFIARGQEARIAALEAALAA